MKAIAADTIFLVPFIGKGIDVGACRHGHVEGGVENCPVGDIGQMFHGGFNPGNIREAMLRSKILKRVD